MTLLQATEHIVTQKIRHSPLLNHRFRISGLGLLSLILNYSWNFSDVIRSLHRSGSIEEQQNRFDISP